MTGLLAAILEIALQLHLRPDAVLSTEPLWHKLSVSNTKVFDYILIKFKCPHSRKRPC